MRKQRARKGRRARVLNTDTGQLGNVVHYATGPWTTKCKVKGRWTLMQSFDAVTCQNCLRRMQ